ncbi:MAG: hypothetical protein IPM82_16375 [Saprospiraceae bacterium]|nr:hypothetical protein [Saprospiraceae bacterium]
MKAGWFSPVNRQLIKANHKTTWNNEVKILRQTNEASDRRRAGAEAVAFSATTSWRG